MAEREEFYLLLENEKDIVGDTPERCQAILGAINSQHLRFAWDPANFVQVGVTRPMDQGWPLLGDDVGYVHVKDALATDGRVCAAGEGDGQVRELLLALRRSHYQGFLALEPHLAIAGRSGGFSGPEGMRYAVSRLRQLMSQAGCVEQPAGSGNE
jgi:sugar phosphate isomerase/epimerase